MNRFIFFCMLFPLIISSCSQGDKDEIADKPNILFILADDLGWSDLGCYGSDFYETPRIDRLAEEGVLFTNAYAACHVCSPTRASILTGQYPARLHLTDWLPGRLDYDFQKLKNAVTEQRLPYGQKTIAQALKEAGYRTAVIGKWHLGEDSMSVERQGFDFHIPGGWKKGWPKEGYFAPYDMEGLEGGADGEYLTDRITDEAIAFIESADDAPFFLYLSHFAVHDPIQGRPDLVKKYEQKLQEMPSSLVPPYILEGNPDLNPLGRAELDSLIHLEEYQGYSLLPKQTVKIKQRQDNPQFAAMVESVDQSVGRLLDKLKELGIDKNTIVVFASDNGGMSAANFYYPEREIPPSELDKEFSTSNLPLRGGKGWLYEGGIRVPLIIKLPGMDHAGSTRSEPVVSVDFYPTLLDLAGMDSIRFGNNGIDGLSIAPLLEKNTDAPAFQKRAIFWHFPHYSNHGSQSPGGAVRYGQFKLLEYYENNTVQLFNLAADPGEQKDISNENPEMADKLRKMLRQWRKEVNADMMEPNPGYTGG